MASTLGKTTEIKTMNELEKLQEQVVFQERTIEQLNDALANQQQQISRLQEELRLLTQLMRQWREDSQSGGSGVGGNTIVHEIPPHY